MDRKHFDAEHLAFAEAFRAFADKQLVPHYLDWERAGITPREVFAEAGRSGFLGMQVPEEYGGGGTSDFRFNQAMNEQIADAGITGSGLGLSLHNDTCLPYFLTFCNDEQKQRWLPGIAAGELITAVAMTEPGAGSDLSGIRTSARRDGDHYVVNGAKTFITNGINADLVITVVRTGEDRHKGLSLLIVERGTDGFERGRNLDKLGLHSQDTAELSFSDARVPVANLLGEEGAGFAQLTQKLPRNGCRSRSRQWPKPAPRSTKRCATSRTARRSVPASARSRTPSSCWPNWSPRSTSRRPGWTCASPASTPVNSRRRTRRSRSGGAPNCRAACSTSACNCTAVTGT